MTRKEAEDYVYESYLTADRCYGYDTADAERRFPGYSADVIRRLCPHDEAVVITGSKGKGSVAVMAEAILRGRYRTGLLTSPHLSDFCERFRIDGTQVSDDMFVGHMARVRQEFEPVRAGLPADRCISPMGVQAAAAMSMFAEAGVERMVLECGKGARYDDVNNVPHRYAVINTVFLEHTRELGSTVAEIAADKAHVITSDTRVVCVGRQQAEALEVIMRRVRAMGAEAMVYGRDFRCMNVRSGHGGTTFDADICGSVYKDLSLPLIGAFQAENCVLAMAACSAMTGGLPTEEQLRRAVASVSRPGRMEILSSDPFILLDACINRASGAGVIACIESMGLSGCCTVIGIPDDKDYAGVAQVMAPVSDFILLTASDNPHYRFTPDCQRETLRSMGIGADVARSVRDSVDRALLTGRPVVILGTTSVVTEVRSVLGLK